MQIVKFSDGQYGIRKSYFFLWYVYKDLKTTSHWWTKGSEYFKDCRGTREEVDEAMKRLTMTDEVVG